MEAWVKWIEQDALSSVKTNFRCFRKTLLERMSGIYGQGEERDLFLTFTDGVGRGYQFPDHIVTTASSPKILKQRLNLIR